MRGSRDGGAGQTSSSRVLHGGLLLALLLIQAVMFFSSVAAKSEHFPLEEEAVHRRHREHNRKRHVLRSCATCPPGWGAVSPSVCAPCPLGSYSPHHSATAGCWLCSRCGAGLFESHPCTPRSDTRCDSCLTARPRPLGADFDRKCLFGRNPESPVEGGGQTVTRVQRKASRRGEASRGWRQNESTVEGVSEEEKLGEDNWSVTWGVVSIVIFQFVLFAAAAAAICHYVRRMHSCLAEDKERTAQEANPLMEVTPSH